jgi:hypothetical protein
VAVDFTAGGIVNEFAVGAAVLVPGFALFHSAPDVIDVILIIWRNPGVPVLAQCKQLHLRILFMGGDGRVDRNYGRPVHTTVLSSLGEAPLIIL